MDCPPPTRSQSNLQPRPTPNHQPRVDEVVIQLMTGSYLPPRSTTNSNIVRIEAAYGIDFAVGQTICYRTGLIINLVFNVTAHLYNGGLMTHPDIQVEPSIRTSLDNGRELILYLTNKGHFPVILQRNNALALLHFSRIIGLTMLPEVESWVRTGHHEHGEWCQPSHP
jgi:dUTPase